MDFTYAEIFDTSSHFYENVSIVPHRSIYSTASSASHSSSSSSMHGNIKKVNMRSSNRSRDDSQLPIDIRYRKSKRTTVYSDAGYYSSAASSSYVGSVSSSSLETVVNGAKPYHTRVSSQVPTSAPIVSHNKPAPKNSSKRPCCVQCREKELRAEYMKQNHHYENIQQLKQQRPEDPYVFLMISVFRKLREEENGKKAARIQHKIEKVLRFKPRELFCTQDEELFNRQIQCFGNDIEIRLHAINDVSADTYREISAKFCEALHSSSSSRGIRGIFKGFKNFFTS